MASVYKHSRGRTPYYIGVFSDETGRQRHRSTKLTKYDEALALCEKWQRQAKVLRKASILKNKGLVLECFISATQQAETGDFSETTARVLLDQILEAGGHGPLRTVTIEGWLNEWLASKKKVKADGTGKRYAKTVADFLALLGPKARMNLTALLPADIERFRDLQVDEGKAASTANMAIKTLRIPLNAARRQGILLTNPAEAVELLDVEAMERSPFSPKQILAILQVADQEWRGLILAGLCTGLRIGNASQLSWNNIDLSRGTICVYPAKRIRGKRRRVLENVLLPDFRDYLLSLPADGREGEAPLFPTLCKVRLAGCNGLSQRFQLIMNQAGVFATADEREIKGKGRHFHNLTYHSLRHTYVSWMANNKVSKEIRMKLAGHTTDVHVRYTHIELDTLRKALQDFPSVSSKAAQEG